MQIVLGAINLRIRGAILAHGLLFWASVALYLTACNKGGAEQAAMLNSESALEESSRTAKSFETGKGNKFSYSYSSGGIQFGKQNQSKNAEEIILTIDSQPVSFICGDRLGFQRKVDALLLDSVSYKYPPAGSNEKPKLISRNCYERNMIPAGLVNNSRQDIKNKSPINVSFNGTAVNSANSVASENGSDPSQSSTFAGKTEVNVSFSIQIIGGENGLIQRDSTETCASLYNWSEYNANFCALEADLREQCGKTPAPCSRQPNSLGGGGYNQSHQSPVQGSP